MGPWLGLSGNEERRTLEEVIHLEAIVSGEIRAVEPSTYFFEGNLFSFWQNCPEPDSVGEVTDDEQIVELVANTTML